ncbi:hypothetical protein [Sunxiuqinia rutila]|uniref:hypothetical protein n=1 Tax=Sunxiuqinia rutila TaxID=1397841 RepID=UPI003D36991E
MKKFANTSIWTSILLSSINAGWLSYNSFQYFNIDQWFDQPAAYVMLLFIGLLVLLFSHITIILSVILNLKKQANSFLAGVLLLIIGTLSLIAILPHWGALTDILKEYPQGFPINSELKAIWIAQSLHGLFIVYALIHFIRLKKAQKSKNQSLSLVSEQLFISLNVVGIVCGLTGLLLVTAEYYLRTNPQTYKWIVIPYSVFVFLPYLLILIGWFIHAVRGRQSGWYDEKQRFDIYKSATVTLVSSVPIMLVLFFSNFNNITGIISMLWLPFYLFIVLLIFSISAMYNFASN